MLSGVPHGSVLGPDVVHNTKIHKQFSSRYGSLTQLMHHSDDKNQIDHYDKIKTNTLGKIHCEPEIVQNIKT